MLCLQDKSSETGAGGAAALRQGGSTAPCRYACQVRKVSQMAYYVLCILNKYVYMTLFPCFYSSTEKGNLRLSLTGEATGPYKGHQ